MTYETYSLGEFIEIQSESGVRREIGLFSWITHPRMTKRSRKTNERNDPRIR